MAEEKKIQVQTFIGGTDTVTADELLSSDSYRHGQNIRILSSAGGKKGIVTNLKGTVEVEFTRPAGQNITIGSEESPEQNKLFFLEWNENKRHSIYYYDILLNKVIKIIENLTDTGNIDILQFKKRSLILHIDIVNDLIYWTDGQVKQKKFNWKRAIDKSNDGYGPLIIEEFINAYKPQPIFPPKLSYFTDTTRPANYLYGNLFKACCRHIFRDGEISNFSEFSTVPLPEYDGFIGNTSVSNQNNCLKISVETGSSDVRYIEIAIKIGILDFVSITTLDKLELGISDDSLYVYSFYNDSNSFSGLDPLNVNRAYSFMPRLPMVQKFVDRAMVYGGGIEGRPEVIVNLEVEAQYTDLFISDGTVNELNSPFFNQTAFDYDFTRQGKGRRRNSLPTLKVGSDVKAGNKYELFGRNGESDNLYFTYTATGSDDAISVANNFKQQLIATGRILSTSEDLPTTDIWTNTIVSGDVSFSFIFRGRFAENATVFEGRVSPVSFQTLKNNGQSVINHKSGGSVKYGIVYWDEDTRRSQTYTSDDAFIRTSFVTETNGYKKVVHKLSIKHRPPIWAKYYEVVRTNDLTYGTSYIHILIQKAIESQSTTDTEYVDLVVGSLFTYQKMFPNTIIKYNFEKNDRVRLIKKETGGTFYTFLETVILDYNDIVTDIKNEDITTNNTTTVTIGGTTSSDNIGRFISIGGVERLIINAPTGSTYTLDREFGTSEKYTSYEIIDRRGTIRVRKPIGVTIEDNSLVEIYKPSQNVEMAEKSFFIFGHKYAIKDWGTDLRSHTGNLQNQDPDNLSTTPAIVSIGNGMSYIRQRQLPTNNTVPDTQAITDLVEDNNFSDLYESDLKDNGKIAPEDNGSGENRFGDRLRFSKNFIEDTKINGLNDFDNTDRVDYNDPFGSFRLLKFKKRLLYAFKDLNTGYIPVNATILRGDNGDGIGLSTSNKLLNELQYFSHEGGIGNMPMSFASGKTWYWFASPNSGTFCRIGGDGILPISEKFNLDSRLRVLLSIANKYKSFVFGGFDLENDEYVATFEAPNESLYNSGFNEAVFELYSSDKPEGTLYEVTTQPANGMVTFDGDGNFVYTPDTDYTGPDYFYYRWKVPGGEWSSPKKECGNVNSQDIPSSPSLYYNEELTTEFTKDNCPDGYHGTDVDYVVPEFKYSSPFNQENADQQAEDETTANGQNYANQNGTCEINVPSSLGSFVNVDNKLLSTSYESNEITIPADYSKYVISISGSGGQYSINGGSWTSANGIVNSGSTVKLRMTSSPSYLTDVITTLSIGGVTRSWGIKTHAGNAELTQSFTRNNCSSGYHGTIGTYTIPANTYFAATQIAADALAQADIDTNGQTRVNGGSGGLGTVVAGTCELNEPIAYTFVDQSGLELSALTESNEITVPLPLSGSTGIFRIVITGGGEYRINGGSWTSATGTVNSGDLLKIRNTTSASNDTTVATTVTLGSVSDEWTIRTKSAGGLAWRVQPASKVCGSGELEGYVFYTTLEQYTVSTGINTGSTKANDSGDPDYIGPVYDTDECPLAGVTQYMLVSYSSVDRPEACGGTIPLPGSPPISVYSSVSNPLINKSLFNNPELTAPWTSVPNNGDYVKFYVFGIPGTTYVGNVDSSGNMTSIVTC